MTTIAKAAIVTGAGGGLGKAIAAELLKGKCKVAVVDINQNNIEATAKELHSIGDVIPLHADITDDNAAKDLVQRTVLAFGQVDVLVNCAGVRDNFEGAHELDVDVYRKNIAVNLTAPIMLSKFAINEFLRDGRSDNKKGGSIVNIVSIAALRGGFAGVAYTSSKTAMIGVTKNIAMLYAKQGITCNAICPGGMATNFMQDSDPSTFGLVWNKVRQASQYMPSYVDTYKIGRLVRFLTSEDGSDINGAVIAFDAGWTAH